MADDDYKIMAGFTYAQLRALSAAMTEEDRREQAISFAWGNVVIENPNVTREMVAEAYDRMRARRDGNG